MIMKYYHINSHDCMVGGSFEKFLIFFTSVFLMQSQPTCTIDSWRSLTERSWLDYSTINKRSLTSRWLLFYANERRLVRETFLKKTETIPQEYWKLIVYLSTNRLCQLSEWSALQLVKWSRPCLSSRMITQLDLYL